MFVTERALPVTDLARACEARGIESLWVPEHPVVPAQYETRYPLAEDGKMPRPYTELPDCFATLDLLSGGRVLFGVGAGWLREEMQLFAPHFPHRFAFLREAIAAMRKLWTEERPSFEGRWVRFPPVVCRPKPVQKPHPPVILGGMGPNARKRVAAWGDGWLPIGLPPDDVAEARREISRRALEHDRDPETLSLSVMIGAAPGLETPSLETIPGRDLLARYRDAGADRVIISLPTLSADDA